MKRRYIFGLFLIIIIFSGCSSMKGKETISQKVSENTLIKSQQFLKNGVVAEYPIIVAGGNSKDINIWNQIIKKDFNKIIDIYSFEPMPLPKPAPTQIPTVLTVKYQTKLNNSNYLSFLYLADFNTYYSAHPSQLTYSTNINKKNNQRISLGDVVKLNKDFVKDFRTWDFIPIEQGNEELNKAIKDYFKNISDDELLNGFKKADILGTGNVMDMYSYMTTDTLGISIGVPNYIGDHVEFEREYDKISNFLKK